jgi:cytochrome c553
MRSKLAFATTLLVGAHVAPASAMPAPMLFAQRCAMCHQTDGTGLPGQFPRLAGRVPTIAQTPAGRRYLALVLLNGMVGGIKVDGQSIAGLMPSMAALKDQELADLLNHAAGLKPPLKGKKPAPFTAAEIAAVRAGGSIGASAVGAERAKIAATGAIP